MTRMESQHSEFDFEGYEAHILAGGAPFGGEHNATIDQAVETYQAVIASLKRERDATLVTVKRLQDELARRLAPDVQRDAELDLLREALRRVDLEAMRRGYSEIRGIALPALMNPSGRIEARDA